MEPSDELEPREWPDPADTLETDSIDLRPCPVCGQPVYEEAEQCTGCGVWLTPHTRRPPWIWALMVVLLVVALCRFFAHI